MTKQTANGPRYRIIDYFLSTSRGTTDVRIRQGVRWSDDFEKETWEAPKITLPGRTNLEKNEAEELKTALCHAVTTAKNWDRRTGKIFKKPKNIHGKAGTLSDPGSP